MNQKKKLSTKLIILIPVFILGIFSIISNVMSVSNIRNVNRSAVQISEVSLKNVSGLAEIQKQTQVEFAKQVGIATSTISEWKKKKTNPTADKIMDICNVLQITPEQLLTGKGIEDEEEIVAASPESRFTPYDIQLIEDYHGLKEEQKKRLMAYVEALKKIESLENM